MNEFSTCQKALWFLIFAYIFPDTRLAEKNMVPHDSVIIPRACDPLLCTNYGRDHAVLSSAIYTVSTYIVIYMPSSRLHSRRVQPTKLPTSERVPNTIFQTCTVWPNTHLKGGGPSRCVFGLLKYFQTDSTVIALYLVCNAQSWQC